MNNLQGATRILGYLSIAILLFACEAPPADPTPTLTPSPTVIPQETPQNECRDGVEPVDEDISAALSFGELSLDSLEWQQTHEVWDDRVRVIWIDQEGGLVFVEALIYICGYTSDSVDQYFSMENLVQVMYADYQDVRVTSNCRNDAKKIRLFEIAATWEGNPYVIRNWVLTDHPHRVLNVMMVFSEEANARLDSYSEMLFPQLASCKE